MADTQESVSVCVGCKWAKKFTHYSDGYVSVQCGWRPSRSVKLPLAYRWDLVPAGKHSTSVNRSCPVREPVEQPK